MNINCPFCIGDIVQFTPSERTQGLYQNIKRFGLEIGQKAVITEIRGVYLYFGKNIGGFPWNEFTLVMKGDIK